MLDLVTAGAASVAGCKTVGRVVEAEAGAAEATWSTGKYEARQLGVR